MANKQSHCYSTTCKRAQHLTCITTTFANLQQTNNNISRTNNLPEFSILNAYISYNDCLHIFHDFYTKICDFTPLLCDPYDIFGRTRVITIQQYHTHSTHTEPDRNKIVWTRQSCCWIRDSLFGVGGCPLKLCFHGTSWF